MYILFCSGGNDSVALMQYMLKKKDIHVLYSDTGWSAPFWPQRMKQIQQFCKKNHFTYHHIPSEGFAALAKRKMAFPRSGMQFCTWELKIKPAKQYMETIDPQKEAICCVGIRREESPSRRQWPKHMEESENHGGRSLFSPLVNHTEKQRNKLIEQAGFDILPHRSMECSPCVNANRQDLRQLDQQSIIKVRHLEAELGVGVRSGKPKYLFRPEKKLGAKGIDEVIKWANANHGQYRPDQEDLFCDSGFCGD